MRLEKLENQIEKNYVNNLKSLIAMENAQEEIRNAESVVEPTANHADTVGKSEKPGWAKAKKADAKVKPEPTKVSEEAEEKAMLSWAMSYVAEHS